MFSNLLDESTDKPSGSAGAPLGNQNALRYPTSETRQELCRKYCEYIKQGYSKEYFPECDYDTFQSYCKDYPIDFPTDVIKQAEREGLHRIEQIGLAGMLGKVPGFRERTWIFVAKNKLGWREKIELPPPIESLPNPLVIYMPEKKPEGAPVG